MVIHHVFENGKGGLPDCNIIVDVISNDHKLSWKTLIPFHSLNLEMTLLQKGGTKSVGQQTNDLDRHAVSFQLRL
jgi:hypothetical protein